jgi:Ala-tRNA(Pro) deacylase
MGDNTSSPQKQTRKTPFSVKGIHMPAQKLLDFLDGEHIRYISIRHPPAYTAQEIAAAVHAPGQELIKTTMIKLDGKMAMAVLPASYQVNFDLLKEIAGVNSATLAGEEEFKDMFPDCEIGAMPPFGNLYGLDVFAAKVLAENEDIVFNAGSHSELITMAYRDYANLVKPEMGDFSEKLG